MKLDPELKKEIEDYLKNHDVKNKKEVIKKYLERRLEDKKKIVKIISAYKLNQEEIRLIMNQFPYLEKRYDKIENEIDEKIMAGVIIKFNSKVLNLTLESKLKSLKKILAN